MAGKKKLTSAREVALQVLLDCRKRGAWSDSALSSAIRSAELNARDAGLASRLCYGVQQNQYLLDYYLEQLCSVALKKLEPAVLVAMELGLYQMTCLDRIPVRAAVDQSVELARRWSRNPRSTGLVNAVLRSYDRQKETLPQPKELWTRHSHPKWLVELFDRELKGEGVEALLEVNNSQPATVVQTNTLKITAEELKARLEGEGVTVELHHQLSDCFTVTGTGDLDQLDSFQEGLFQVQDAAAKLAVLAADPKPGMKVLDACAAPGGKSFQVAMAMENQGSILSCDLQEKKLSRIRTGAERLGIDCITARPMDGRVFEPEMEKSFDLVIADVPCSGLGIIRKKPDIRYKDSKPLENLPQIQSEILENVSRYVSPGGMLLYSTCTVLERENQAVVRAFLKQHSEYRLEPFAAPIVGECDGMVTLWPHIHGTDGFFIAKLRRNHD